MDKQLKKSSWKLLSFIAVGALISACGRSSRLSTYTTPVPTGQTMIPTLDPFVNSSTTNTTPNLTIAAVGVQAVPSQSAQVGSVIYLVASGFLSGSSFNFQFTSNSIGASFSGSTTGVTSVGVTSSNPGSVTISVTSTSGNLAPASISLNFTGSSSQQLPYSRCSIQGPYAISYYGQSNQGFAAYPTVGGSYYFTVQENLASYNSSAESLKILNVWTQDPTETGRYYNSWSKFWMTFNGGGQKTIFVKAQSLSTGAVCDAQLTLQVSQGGFNPPTPGPVMNCGLSEGYTGLGYCTQAIVYSYFFDGYQCQLKVGENGCAPKGPFQTMSACQQTVSAGYCGGTPAQPPVTSCGKIVSPSGSTCPLVAFAQPQSRFYIEAGVCRQVIRYSPCDDSGPFTTYSECQTALSSGQCGGTTTPTQSFVLSVDSRATQWYDTGIDLSAGTRTQITASGSVRFDSIGSLAGPNGLDSRNVPGCKVTGGESLRNVALVGKIGATGTPFLVGEFMDTYYLPTGGRLYLIVNDSKCAADNFGSFSVTVRKNLNLVR